MSDSGAFNMSEIRAELRELQRLFSERGVDALDVTGQMLHKISAVQMELRDVSRDHRELERRVVVLEESMGIHPNEDSIPVRVKRLEQRWVDMDAKERERLKTVPWWQKHVDKFFGSAWPLAIAAVVIGLVAWAQACGVDPSVIPGVGAGTGG